MDATAAGVVHLCKLQSVGVRTHGFCIQPPKGNGQKPAAIAKGG